MKKFKSYGFWVSLTGAIVVFVEAIGRAFGFIPNKEIISDIIMGIAGILVVFGIVTINSEDKSESEGEELDKEKDDKK